jgi:putative SOS response-associated peptidase YedK
MCGRYSLTTPAEALARLFGLELAFDLLPRYNIAPSQDILAVRKSTRGGKEFVMLRWGLTPSWATPESYPGLISSPPINARAETLDTKPSFRDAFRKRRCLVPADGYYEWQKSPTRKRACRIRRQGDEPFAFAAIWEAREAPARGRSESCAIITSSATGLLADIHGRMPVIIRPDNYDAWLSGPEDYQFGPKHILRDLVPHDLEAYPVNHYVNDVRIDDPRCIESSGNSPATLV